MKCQYDKKLVMIIINFLGGIDLGTKTENNFDVIHEAKNALVFMAVTINGGWRVSLG